MATIIGALPAIPKHPGSIPGLGWLLTFRFLAGVGLPKRRETGRCASHTPPNTRRRESAAARSPLCSSSAVPGPWPVGVLRTLAFRDTIGWRGVWMMRWCRRANCLRAALFAFPRIAALAGDAWPWAARARPVAADGNHAHRRSTACRRTPRATRIATRSLSSWSRYPGRCHRRDDLLLSRFSRSRFRAGAWLPNILASRGVYDREVAELSMLLDDARLSDAPALS